MKTKIDVIQEDFIKEKCKEFFEKNGWVNYFMYRDRVVGNTPEHSKAFIDFIIEMNNNFITGQQVADYLANHHFCEGGR